MEIGERLKEARETKGLSLESLQETTKIQKRYLEAIEKNDFEVLPGKFYTRAFIREYASAVGLDPEQVMEEHKSELPTFEDESTVQYSRVQRTKKEASQKSGRSSGILPTIITVGLIVGLLFVAWIFWQSGSEETGSTESNQDSNDEINVPADSEGEEKTDQNTEDEVSEEQNSENEDSEEGQEGTDSQEGEEDSSNEEDEEKNSEDSLDIQLSEEGSGSFPEHTYVIKGVQDGAVTIELSGTVYMEVQSPKGGENLVTPREYTASESPLSLDLEGSEELFIKTGHAPGTVVKVDDQEVPFPDPEKSTQKLLLQFQ